MNHALLHRGLLLALVLAVSVMGCDTTTEDEFRDFEGSWTVTDLEVADDDDEELNSFFNRLSDEYDSSVTFSFTESDGVEEFEIFARRDKANTEHLSVAGDVQFASGNSMNLVGDFLGRGTVRADYFFSGGQLFLTADDFDGESLLDTLLPRRTNPDTPVVRITLERL